MISDKCLALYRKAFPESVFRLSMCSGELYVKPNDAIGTPKYIVPRDETDETFIDRIERSKQAGRNLFFEEWPEAKPVVHDPEKLY